MTLIIDRKRGIQMIGFYDYTVVLTYISMMISVYGITLCMDGHFKRAIVCLALSGLCDMFDGKIARTKKNRTDEEKCFGITLKNKEKWLNAKSIVVTTKLSIRIIKEGDASVVGKIKCFETLVNIR